MYQLPEPTRPTLDLLDEGVVIPGWTIVTWTATGPRLAWPPRPSSKAEVAECRCPRDCTRDHEHE